MRYYIHILLLLLLASCVSTKKVHTDHTTVKKDSTNTVTVYVHDTVNQEHTVYLHDTVVNVAGKKVSINLTADETKPAYDSKGKKVPRYYSVDTSGIHLNITVDTMGALHIYGFTDSSSLLIQNIRVEKDRWKSSFDSLTTAVAHNNSTITTHTEDKTVRTGGWLFAIKWLVIGIIAGLLLPRIIRFIITIIKHYRA